MRGFRFVLASDFWGFVSPSSAEDSQGLLTRHSGQCLDSVAMIAEERVERALDLRALRFPSRCRGSSLAGKVRRGRRLDGDSVCQGVIGPRHLDAACELLYVGNHESYHTGTT
jgi:hypothetical protein